MIGRKNRFHGHNSLNYVYQHGQTVRGPLCAVKYAVNSRRPNYRAVVVVSKKISKSAVVRNRIRRRLYEQLRLQAGSITKPYDIVITLFNEHVATMPADELQRMLRAQLLQAGILSKQGLNRGIVNKKEKS